MSISGIYTIYTLHTMHYRWDIYTLHTIHYRWDKYTLYLHRLLPIPWNIGNTLMYAYNLYKYIKHSAY